MTPRERVAATLAKEKPDRLPVHEGLWSETVEKWRKEGHLPADVDPADFFEYDLRGICWYNTSLQLPDEKISETDEFIISKDANGVTAKRVKGESGHTPHWMDWTIKNRDDWFAHKERLVFNRERLPADIAENNKKLHDRGLFTIFTGVEAYECAWPVFGQVRIFELMMDDPELIADVFRTYTDLIIAGSEWLLANGVDFDGAFFCGDMGYRNSTLFSPRIYKELLWPQHKRMCEYFRSAGRPVMLHSCGRILDLIPDIIAAGFASLNPLEAKCGQDVRELTKIYGKQIVWDGNIDVRKLSGTKADVEQEVLSKLSAAAKGGGMIFHSDHSVPQTVPFENYKYAVELARSFVP